MKNDFEDKNFPKVMQHFCITSVRAFLDMKQLNDSPETHFLENLKLQVETWME